MALASARVRAEIVEVAEFPDLAQRYDVYAVPKVVLNDTLAFEGALSEAAFVQYVGAAAQQGDAAAPEPPPG